MFASATSVQVHSIRKGLDKPEVLSKIDESVPAELDVHLILDNSSIHKTLAIRAWLAKRPRFHLHFTPTSSS